jgi:hypothetical protein
VGFPVLVETTENRTNDPVHAFDVGEDDHGPGAPTDLDETALDNNGSTQLPWPDSMLSIGALGICSKNFCCICPFFLVEFD